MTDVTIEPLTVPKTISDPDAADFIEAQDLMNRVTASLVGGDDFSRTPEERLPYMFVPGWRRSEFVAKANARIVGWARYETTEGPEVRECSLELSIDPDFRRQGIGSALLDRLMDSATADGRTELMSRVMARSGVPGPRVTAESGTGSLAAEDAGMAFALAKGFLLDEVDVLSRLRLPVPETVMSQRTAVARAGYEGDYELVHWAGPTPAEYLDDVAALYTEMSTADPIGDHEGTVDVWDADRLRAYDELQADSPRKRLIAAAREIASGSLVAFTMLDVPGAPDGTVNQWSTLVSTAHRGRRLGLAVKLENVRQVMDDFPGHPNVTTMSSEANEHMRSVNDAVGFEAAGQVGFVRRVLDASDS